MRNWTEQELIEEGYKIENVKISDADLILNDVSCFVLHMELQGKGRTYFYGGYILGHDFSGNKYDDPMRFDGDARGMESIIRIMDICGRKCFSELEGCLMRVARKDKCPTVIGHIIEDRWFDIESFYDEYNDSNMFC